MAFEQVVEVWRSLQVAGSDEEGALSDLERVEIEILTHRPVSADQAVVMIDCVLENHDARTDGLDRDALVAIRAFLVKRCSDG